MVNHAPDKELVTAAILAGGRATRMDGRDKGLVELAGRPMIEYVIDALASQTAAILINANRNPDRYARYGYAVVADEDGGFHGPLAGMAACMNAASTPLVVTAPCDSPFVPGDLVQRLLQRLRTDGAEICVAHDGQRLQPVFCLLHTRLLDSVRTFLAADGRKIDAWFPQHRLAICDFSDQSAAFLNINTPGDLERIAAEMEQRSRGAA
jgi:molybdopterin-guanine dinucleotide biosynthesis protein A